MGYIGKVTTSDGSTHLVGSTLYGTCSTAAATAAKVVTLTNFSSLETGVTIHVKFTYTNSAANPTLNVNSTGAKTIYRYGTTAPSTSAKTSWNANAVVSFTYDGTNWMMNDWLNDDTTYSAATTSSNGLMSSSDKSKLDGIASGATAVTTNTVSGWGYTKNAGTVTTTGTMTSGHVVLSNGNAVIKDSGCGITEASTIDVVYSLSGTLTDSQIPTAKAVKDSMGNVASLTYTVVSTF